MDAGRDDAAARARVLIERCVRLPPEASEYRGAFELASARLHGGQPEDEVARAVVAWLRMVRAEPPPPL